MSGFTYWEGPKPAFIEMCHELMEMHNIMFKVYTENDIRNGAVPGIEDYVNEPLFWKLHPAHRADIIRVKALHNNDGGYWVDSDFICLNNLNPLYDISFNTGKFLYYADSWGPTNGILFAPPGHSLITEWSRKIDAVFAGFVRRGEIPHSSQWTIFGADQMRVLLPIALEPVQDLGWDRVQLISYQKRESMFETDNVKDKAWMAAYGYMLFNTTGIPDWFRTLNKQDILNGPWLISEIFRIAYKQGFSFTRAL